MLCVSYDSELFSEKLMSFHQATMDPAPLHRTDPRQTGIVLATVAKGRSEPAQHSGIKSLHSDFDAVGRQAGRDAGYQCDEWPWSNSKPVGLKLLQDVCFLETTKVRFFLLSTKMMG